ncbi:MAG: S24/S26 family peptidase [Clostridia bacterium]|nr:S24/S26 family peptidase [Clostridia bacterium]
MESPKIEARDIFENLPDEGITLKVQGTSMQPFLYDGRDAVTLKKPDRELEKGDVIVFRRGKFYVMHRIVKIDNDGFITAMGDNTFSPDTHIASEDVKAILVSAIRAGKTISPKSPEWLFFSKIFINLNVRKFIGKVRKQ